MTEPAPATAPLLGAWGTTVKELATRWTAYTAFGSFVLYLLGYLALRFHLTALGVGTDLAVLDERYLFTGARFLVYWASSIPIALLLVAAVAALAYGGARLLPRASRERLRDRARAFLAAPRKLTIAGIVLSVALIQLVLRKCFLLGNVLLGPGLPREPRLLAALLDRPELMPLFFSAIVTATAVSVAAAVQAARAAGPDRKLTFDRGLLGVLIAIQLLLLPVNYGVLIVDKSLARVAAVGNELLAPGQEAWLVWEGKDGITYLVRRPDGARSLVTLPRSENKRIEIQAYDPWTAALAPRPPEGAARAEARQ